MKKDNLLLLLQGHIEKLSEDGKRHVPMDLALSIARDVSGALVELHSKDIIHRDIKSENVLINLDNGEEPVVKLCDFDRAVPLRSHLHGCCIAHVGIPPANVCVGTPRWMSPEVFRAMHEHSFYGLVRFFPPTTFTFCSFEVSDLLSVLSLFLSGSGYMVIRMPNLRVIDTTNPILRFIRAPDS